MLIMHTALASYLALNKGNPNNWHRAVKRNAFIATEILNSTGSTRTPRQVGSRIQTIRKIADPHGKPLETRISSNIVLSRSPKSNIY